MSDIVASMPITELRRRIAQHERFIAELRTLQAAGWPNAAVLVGRMNDKTPFCPHAVCTYGSDGDCDCAQPQARTTEQERMP